ncbi:hypothetical protein, partial [Azospirillum brasilense]|uniref:hypothetical protein n=1 Tax=Azospirillum brasilense TaxID=192 RepID=UPI0009CF1068
MNDASAPPPAPTTVAQALAHAQAIGLARIDAQLLLLHTLGRPDAGRAWLLAHDEDRLSAEEQQQQLRIDAREADCLCVREGLGDRGGSRRGSGG